MVSYISFQNNPGIRKQNSYLHSANLRGEKGYEKKSDLTKHMVSSRVKTWIQASWISTKIFPLYNAGTFEKHAEEDF